MMPGAKTAADASPTEAPGDLSTGTRGTGAAKAPAKRATTNPEAASKAPRKRVPRKRPAPPSGDPAAPDTVTPATVTPGTVTPGTVTPGTVTPSPQAGPVPAGPQPAETAVPRPRASRKSGPGAPDRSRTADPSGDGDQSGDGEADQAAGTSPKKRATKAPATRRTPAPRRQPTADAPPTAVGEPAAVAAGRRSGGTGRRLQALPESHLPESHLPEPHLPEPAVSTPPSPTVTTEADQPAGVRPVRPEPFASHPSAKEPPGLWEGLWSRPGYAPELLALDAVRRLGPQTRHQLHWLHERYPDADLTRFGPLACRRFVRQATVAGVATGLSGPPGALADLAYLTRLQAGLVLQLAGGYGLPRDDCRRAAELLVLQDVHAEVAAAESALATALGSVSDKPPAPGTAGGSATGADGRRAAAGGGVAGGRAAGDGAAHGAGQASAPHRLRETWRFARTGVLRFAVARSAARLLPGAGLLIGLASGAGGAQRFATRALRYYAGSAPRPEPVAEVRPPAGAHPPAGPRLR